MRAFRQPQGCQELTPEAFATTEQEAKRLRIQEIRFCGARPQGASLGRFRLQ